MTRRGVAPTWYRRLSACAVGVLGGVLLAACGGDRPAGLPAAAPAAAATGTAGTGAGAGTPATATHTLTFTYDRPVVGAAVRVASSGLPPGAAVDLVWDTVSGGWVIEDYYHFRGRKYEPAQTSLGRFTVGADGRLDAGFVIPEDFGGMHEVRAVIDGRTVAQKGIEVTQHFELTPRSGPVGTPIELRVTGLGFRTMDSTWVVNWDNHMLGFVSAASSRGSAVARFRAAGPGGDHMIHVLTGYQGQGYLNHEQAPTAYLPRPQFTFRTTAGAVANHAYVEPYQRQEIPPTELHVTGASLALSATQGPVGSTTRLQGRGFTPGSRLEVVWETAVGSRVSGEGFGPAERALGTVTVAADGALDAPLTIPDDVGGRHGIVLRTEAALLARAFFAVETSIVSISPRSGPVGTPVTIHLKGVGWTEYDNIYIATYDNAYMGYACGFNSAGDVVINFIASGTPGAHVIDLYPGIYQGPPTEQQMLYRQAQLTYADDHPGNRIPAVRFTFEITSAAR